jgi:hypothetical protein
MLNQPKLSSKGAAWFEVQMAQWPLQTGSSSARCPTRSRADWLEANIYHVNFTGRGGMLDASSSQFCHTRLRLTALEYADQVLIISRLARLEFLNPSLSIEEKLGRRRRRRDFFSGRHLLITFD